MQHVKGGEVCGVSLCTSDYSRKIFRSRGFELVSDEKCCEIQSEGEMLFPGVDGAKTASGFYRKF